MHLCYAADLQSLARPQVPYVVGPGIGGGPVAEGLVVQAVQTRSPNPNSVWRLYREATPSPGKARDHLDGDQAPWEGYA